MSISLNSGSSCPEVSCKKGVMKNFRLKPATLTAQKMRSDSLTFQKKIVICFNDSPSKMIKNAFYFILKAVFGHVEKTA